MLMQLMTTQSAEADRRSAEADRRAMVAERRWTEERRMIEQAREREATNNAVPRGTG